MVSFAGTVQVSNLISVGTPVPRITEGVVVAGLAPVATEGLELLSIFQPCNISPLGSCKYPSVLNSKLPARVYQT